MATAGPAGWWRLGAGTWPCPSPSLSGLATTRGSLAPRGKGAASVLPGLRCPRPVQSSPSQSRDAVSVQTMSPCVTRCSFRTATQTHRPLPAAGQVMKRSVPASRSRAAVTPALGPPSWLSGPWPFHAALRKTPGKAGSAQSSPATQTLGGASPPSRPQPDHWSLDLPSPPGSPASDTPTALAKRCLPPGPLTGPTSSHCSWTRAATLCTGMASSACV